MKRALAAAAYASLALACAGASRDVAVESHDKVVDRDEAKAAGEYAYVARRPHGVIALAEARGIPLDDAARAVDRLADTMEGCAANLGKSGKLVDGAIRIAAQVAPDGSIQGMHLTLPPGNAVEANALLCVVAPWKLTSFPLADAGAKPRGLAIEATWGSGSGH